MKCFLKIVLAAAFVLPAYATLVVPPDAYEFVQGSVSVSIPRFSRNGPASCYYLTPANPECSLSITSNQPNSGNPYVDQNTGSASGLGQAYVNNGGAHLFFTGTGSGEANIQISGYATYGDQITNNTNAPETYAIGVHVDASLSVVGTSYITFYATGVDPIYLGPGGAGQSQYVNADSVLAGTIAPNSMAFWSVIVDGSLQVFSSPGAVAVAGLPTGTIDAGNTASVTSYSVFDQYGNLAQPSDYSSGAGFSVNNPQSVPEPATWMLLAGALLLLALRHHFPTRGWFPAAPPKAMKRSPLL